MNLITDVHEISRISDLNRQENFDFRAKIKWESESPDALDGVVNKIQREISAKIDCRKCANCCKTYDIPLTEHDIRRLANGMRLEAEEFKKQYLRKADEGNGLQFKTKPCPLLSDGSCSQYEHRPDVCREYPHLDKTGFLGRTLDAIDNCSTCPIVFNVWEQLKQKLSSPHKS